MPRPPTPLAVFLALALALPGGARAEGDDPARAEAVTAALTELLQLVAFADANASLCAERAPDASAGVVAARDAWRAAEGLEEPLARLRALTADSAKALDALHDALEANALARIRRKVAGREADWCRRFPALLSSDDWRLADRYGQEIATLADFVGTLTGEPVRLPRRELAPVTATGYAEAVAAGLDPEDEFLPGEFACYDRGGTDFAAPQLVVQVAADGTYRSGLGDGRYAMDAEHAGDVDFATGALAGARASIDLDERGQSFSLRGVSEGGDEEADYGCFARGPRERAARALFAAKVPLHGDYACRDPDGRARTLTLAPGDVYRIDGAEGRYAVGEILGDDASSRISWTGGPFDGGGSYHEVDPADGYRRFEVNASDGATYPGFVYSSSELAFTCEAMGPPVDLPRFGEDTAPAVPRPSRPLDGLFAHDEYVANGTAGTVRPVFYRFFPYGRVFVGTPEADPADIDCTRTFPSGAPVCEPYRTDGGRLAIGTDPSDEPASLAFDGDVPVVDGEPMVRVGPNGRTRLDGPWWANAFWSIGICGEFSFCSSSYEEWNWRFTPAGRFAYTGSSQNLSSMSTAIASTSAVGGGEDSAAGSYRIDDHTIELAWDNGRTERRFIHFVDDELFVMGDGLYSPRTEDDDG